MDRIDPMVDVAFKMIFNEEELLKSFLNSFLDFKIQNLEISHQEPTKKESIKDKESFLDIKAITEVGKIINIEVQLEKQSFYQKRSLFYTSKLVSGDLKIKENYTEVPKVISINILDFKIFKNVTAFKTHFVKYEIDQKIVLDEHPETYFIEMPKITKDDLSLNNKFHHWLLFLKPSKNEQMYKEVVKLDENIQKAEKKAEHIKQDPVLRAKYEARFKQLTDEANRLFSAKEEGREEGLQEGLAKGKKEGILETEYKERSKTVKMMQSIGFSLEDIEKKVDYDPKKYI